MAGVEPSRRSFSLGDLQPATILVTVQVEGGGVDTFVSGILPRPPRSGKPISAWCD